MPVSSVPLICVMGGAWCTVNDANSVLKLGVYKFCWVFTMLLGRSRQGDD